MLFQFSQNQLFISGISPDIQYILLFIPILSFIYVLLRYVIGINLLEIDIFISFIFFIIFFNPLLSFPYLVLQSSLILIFLYVSVYFIKKYLLNISVHYFSKSATLISLISVSLILIFSFCSFIESYFSISYINATDISVLIISVYLSINFFTNQNRNGIKESKSLFFNTLFSSIFVASIVSISFVYNFVLLFPFVIFIFLIGIILIGSYKGLQLTELIRFRSIINEDND